MVRSSLSLICALALLAGSVAALVFVLFVAENFPFWALIAPAVFLVVSIDWIKENLIRPRSRLLSSPSTRAKFRADLS